MPEETTSLPDVEAPAAKPAKKHSTTRNAVSAPASKQRINQQDDVLAAMEDIQKRLAKVERRLFWMMLSGWLKILIIVVPIVLGILYLPPLIENYKPLFSASAGGVNIIEQFQELFGAPPK